MVENQCIKARVRRLATIKNKFPVLRTLLRNGKRSKEELCRSQAQT